MSISPSKSATSREVLQNLVWADRDDEKGNATVMMQVRLITLGGVRCYVDGEELTDLPNQRLRCALLIYLAVSRDVTREALQNTFWSDRDDEKGRAALKQTVYELRRALGEDCIQSQGDRLKTASHITTDVEAFRGAVRTKDWDAALGLYQGAFLQGFALPNCKPFEFWADGQAAQLTRAHRAARRARIAAHIAAHELHAALGFARRWVELEPLDDEAQHKLIELLAATGERADALQQCDRYERLLHAEELQALDETRELMARLRAGERVTLSNSGSTNSAPAQAQAFAINSTGIESGRPRTPTDTRAPEPGRVNWSARWLAVATVAMLLFTSLLVWPAFRPARGRQIRTVAVLPFENMSANREATEYQSDGLTDALINALTQITELRVTARTSSFVFRNAQRDIREIGRALNVDAIVEGTWRPEGSILRVTAKLTSVKDGYILWSKEYEREIKQTFQVQDEIVRAIVKALALELGAAEAARLAERPTENLDAYDEYLRGLYEFNKGTRDGIIKAIDHFDAAIRVDTTFALAYAGLVDAQAMRQAIGSVPRAAACPIIRNAARRALALDSSLAQVRSAVARTLWNCDDNLAGAEKEFLRSIEINPNLPNVRSNYGMMLSMVLLRFEKGIQEMRYARSLDPLSAIEMNRAANAFRAARLFDSAAILYKRVREIDPTIGNTELNLARTYIALGRWREASAILDSVVTGGRNIRRALGTLAFIQGRYGSRDSALALLEQLKGMSRQESVWDGIALAYAGLGDDSRTLTALDSGVVNRPANFPILLNEPAMDGVRDSVRFQRVLRELGLPHLTVRQRDSLAARMRQ